MPAEGVLCRLVRQMLETKQKSQADAAEEKRKMQQSALAKYRQAFTSDTEVSWAHTLGNLGCKCNLLLPPVKFLL